MQIGLILSVLMQSVIVFYAQRLFKQDNSRVNRHTLHECKRFYKHLIRPKKYNFQVKNLDSIERLKHCKPQEFGNISNHRKIKTLIKLRSLIFMHTFLTWKMTFFRILMLTLIHFVIPMILITLMLIMMLMIWIRV